MTTTPGVASATTAPLVAGLGWPDDEPASTSAASPAGLGWPTDAASAPDTTPGGTS